MGGLKGGKIVNDEANRARIEAAAKLVKRIERGDADDVTGQEALARFGVVASNLPPEDLDNAAEKELEKLPEDQRVEFGKLMQQAGQIDADVDVTDVRALARATSTGSAGGAGIAGLLGGLTGGGGGSQAGGLDIGGLLGGLMGSGGGTQAGGGLDLGGLLGGLMGGGGGGQQAPAGGGLDLGDLINNSLVKSVIAGIAGNGMEKVVGNAGGIDNLLGGLVGGDTSTPASIKEDDGDLPNPKKGVVA
jgi:hypothetical protein